MSNINSYTQQRIVESLAESTGQTLNSLVDYLGNVPKNTIRGSLTKLAKRGEVVRHGRVWYRSTPASV